MGLLREEGRGGRGGTPLREWAVARVMVIRGWSARLIGRPGACTYPCQRTRVGADKLTRVTHVAGVLTRVTDATLTLLPVQW